MDGNYFIKLLDENTNEINKLCKEYRVYLPLDDQTSPNIITNEEILGQLQTTIGKAQLLINQKFKQFRELCNKNLRDKLASPESTSPSLVVEFVTRDDDLAGFWDMVCLQIDDIHKMFNLLDEIRKNDWNVLSSAHGSHSTQSTIYPTSNTTNANRTNGSTYLANKTNGNRHAAKKPSTAVSLAKKRITPPPPATSTITIESSTTNDSTTTTTTAAPVKTAAQLKAEASRQRLLEAKKNAFLVKQKREAEERLLKQQQELAASDDLAANTAKPITADNQFFSISS